MGQRAARVKKEDDQNVCLINFFCFISIYFYVFSSRAEDWRSRSRKNMACRLIFFAEASRNEDARESRENSLKIMRADHRATETHLSRIRNFD